MVTPKAQATIHDKITACSGNTDTSWSVVTATYGTPNAFRWKGSLIYHLLQSDTVLLPLKEQKTCCSFTPANLFFSPKFVVLYVCWSFVNMTSATEQKASTHTGPNYTHCPVHRQTDLRLTAKSRQV